ncbi:transcription antitermination protein [Enterococcus mediterraneensis]|uniref:transcription antitermination protein n=1 Tax=Enterococcus mediterraneensis TaxID=2364791 RepID=UPI000F06600E|nr:transcription antitermination protein [Enterococcus mediterraneensis]
MITKTEIEIGKKYEVKPSEFQRSFVGVAKKVTDKGILFEVEYCDICDRDKAHNTVVADCTDVKQSVGEKYFFS